jgi:hypothetical protein
MKKIGILIVAVCCIAAFESFTVAQTGAQPQAWQQSWSAYGAELGKQLGTGVDPDSELGKKTFYSKNVTWEGTLRLSFKGEPKERLEFSMAPLEFPVALSWFLGQAGVFGTTRVKVTQLSASPATSAVDAWKKVAVGSDVRFRANTGTSPIIQVATHASGAATFRGLALFVESAERITP